MEVNKILIKIIISLIFSIITLFIFTFLIACLLEDIIYFSLLIEIPCGIISSVIVFIISLRILNKK
jgi:hypothetical protein